MRKGGGKGGKGSKGGYPWAQDAIADDSSEDGKEGKGGGEPPYGLSAQLKGMQGKGGKGSADLGGGPASIEGHRR